LARGAALSALGDELHLLHQPAAGQSRHAVETPRERFAIKGFVLDMATHEIMLLAQRRYRRASRRRNSARSPSMTLVETSIFRAGGCIARSIPNTSAPAKKN